jgi:hypothetical protein
MNNRFTLIRTDAAGVEYEIMTDHFDRVAERWLELADELPSKALDEYRIEDDMGGDHFVEELSPENIEALLPRYLFEWQICDRCRGNGTCLIDGLEGVAFSAEEFNETFDPEERERYFSGGYDRPCPTCNATGKVLVLDEERFTQRAPRLAKHRQDWLDDAYETRLLYEAERRIGA